MTYRLNVSYDLCRVVGIALFLSFVRSLTQAEPGVWPRKTTVTTRKQPRAVSAVFREVNERISEVADSWLDSEARELVCECGDPSCTEAIAVARSDYEEARKRPALFLVAAEHVGDDPDAKVLEAGDGYAMIEYQDAAITACDGIRALSPGASERGGVLDDFQDWIGQELPRMVADAKNRYLSDPGGKPGGPRAPAPNVSRGGRPRAEDRF